MYWGGSFLSSQKQKYGTTLKCWPMTAKYTNWRPKSSQLQLDVSQRCIFITVSAERFSLEIDKRRHIVKRYIVRLYQGTEKHPDHFRSNSVPLFLCVKLNIQPSLRALWVFGMSASSWQTTILNTVDNPWKYPEPGLSITWYEQCQKLCSKVSVPEAGWEAWKQKQNLWQWIYVKLFLFLLYSCSGKKGLQACINFHWDCPFVIQTKAWCSWIIWKMI